MKPYGYAKYGQIKNHMYPHDPAHCRICAARQYGVADIEFSNRNPKSKIERRAAAKRARRENKIRI